MNNRTFFLSVLLLFSSQLHSNDSDQVVTAQKYIEYKRAAGHLDHFEPPKIVLILYQQSSLKHFLKNHPEAKCSESFPELYFVSDGKIAILGGWGFGAPAVCNKMEQLIVLGVKKFIAAGTAGSLLESQHVGDYVISPSALPEDGVSHLYLPKNQAFAEADQSMLSLWKQFAEKKSLPSFHSVAAWSFPAMFRETPAEIKRVRALGCGIVEMEAATIYAIGQDKGVQTLCLFVVSDLVTPEKWTPHIKEPAVRNNLHQLVEWSLQFCQMHVEHE